MVKEDISSHIDDIINSLNSEGKKISREEIEDEFTKFMEYGVPVDQAKQTLIKKYGGTAVIPSSSSSTRTLISDLKPNQSSVKVLGHVIAVNPKEINVRGENRTIHYGILGDESGTIPFTAWGDVDLSKGDVVEITNAYTREWQGAVQLNLGDRVNIVKTDKEKLPEEAFEPKEAKIKDLRSGMGRVDVTAKILKLEERETEVNGEKKKVFSGLIADDTGKAQFTAWNDFKLKEGDVFRITGGYVKSWKGIPQLTFDSNATVKKIKKSNIAKEIPENIRMPLHALVEKGGALGVEVEGTVIDIRPGSGVVLRCPECNRVIQSDICTIHGKVKGVADLRVKIVVDDGSGAVDSVLNRELTEKILGKKFDECKKMKNDELGSLIRDKVFAKRIVLKGNALSDSFGTSIIAKDVDFVDVDIGVEAEKIIRELEDLL